MNYILAPSILSADFLDLNNQIKQVEEAGAKYLHFDVMDGLFVPNISLNFSKYLFGSTIIRCTSSVRFVCPLIHLRTGIPKEIFGTNKPSITSK